LPRQIAAHVVVDGADARDEAAKEIAPLLRAQVERDAARAAVERLVIEPIVRRRIVVRRDRARLVTARRRILDLDDLRAEIGEEHEPERPGAELGEVEDADSAQGQRRVDTHEAMLLHSPRPFNEMSSSGAFMDVIKRGREPERALSVDEFLAGLDAFIAQHNPYRINKVIPAIGSGRASRAIVNRYAMELYYLGLWMT